MIIEGRLCGAYCVVVKLSLCCRELPVWVWEISSSSLDSSDEWGEKTMTWHHRSLQRSPDYPLVLLTARVRLQSESDHHHLLFSPQMENWGGPSCICPPPHLTTPAQTRILTEVRLFTTVDIDIDIDMIIRLSARDRGGLGGFRKWFLFPRTSFTESVHWSSNTGVYR